jgi:hypothetical protein
VGAANKPKHVNVTRIIIVKKRQCIIELFEKIGKLMQNKSNPTIVNTKKCNAIYYQILLLTYPWTWIEITQNPQLFIMHLQFIVQKCRIFNNFLPIEWQSRWNEKNFLKR